MRKSTKRLIISAITLGLIVSLYSTYFDFLIHWGMDSGDLLCGINKYIDCKSIYLSEHSTVFGMSKSFLGLIYYIILLLNFIFLSQQKEESRFNVLLLIIAIGAIFSFYNLYLLIFVIQKICLLCLSLQAINILLLVTIIIERRHQYTEVYSIKFTYYFYAQLVISFCILFLGFHTQNKINRYLSIDFGPYKADNSIVDYYSSDKIEFNFDSRFPILGNKNSKLEIVLISDFQCTYCRDAATTLRELYTQHQNDVKIIFVHYPLDKSVNPHTPKSNHLYAGLAAKATICLPENKSFWEVHDYFFENQKNFSNDFFDDYLERYNLKDCIDDQATIEFLNYNMDLAKMANVKGTPSLFINGRPVSKWYDKDYLSKVIHFEQLHNLTLK